MSEKEKSKLEGTTIEVKAGSRIIGEDELSRKMFIIKKGRVRVYKTYLGQKVNLAVLGAGEVFGELSFFDAEPRSASVEALSDSTLVVIDGEIVSGQIDSLPTWVMPIFKSVFHRFRELDQQNMVLQHVYDFQKRHQKTDGLAQGIYLELQRYLKTLMLLHSNEEKINGKVDSKTLFKEMQDVLGDAVIGLRGFWKVMKLHDFIDSLEEESNQVVVLRTESIKKFQDYLSQQADDESYMLLSRSALSILRKIAGHIHDYNPDLETQDSELKLLVEKMDLESVQFKKEALEELEKHTIIKKEFGGAQVLVRPSVIFQVFTYQSVLKSFDHSTLGIE